MLGSTLSKFLKLDDLLGNLAGYVETKVEIVKLEAKQEIAAGVARIITYMILSFAAGMILLFVSLGVAVLLAGMLGALAGYSIVAGVYLIAFVVLFANREKLIVNFEKNVNENFKRKK
jgi:hypothetical protein